MPAAVETVANATGQDATAADKEGTTDAGAAPDAGPDAAEEVGTEEAGQPVAGEREPGPEGDGQVPATPAAGSGDQGGAAVEQEADRDGATACSLDPDGYILIQDEQDKDETGYGSFLTGDVSAGDVLWANAYDWDDWVIKAEPDWSYQWLVGDSKTGADNEYVPIEGQTSQSLTITDELAEQLAGKYLRVKVSDGGTELYGPESASNTPGPVMAPGTTSLCRVELWRGDAKVSGDDDAIINPGDTLEARAYTGGGSADTASNGEVVAEGVTYSWELLDNADAEAGESLGSEAAVTLGDMDDLIGKYVRVTADAGAGEVSYTKGPIAMDGALRLASISIELADGKSSISPGDTLTAKPVLTGGVEPDEDAVSYQWYIKHDGASEYVKMDGETGKTLAVTEDHLGATFKVEATAGGYNYKSATTEYDGGPVQGADSAQAAVAALNDAGYMPNPAYGTDTNMARMVEAKLDELGFAGATVRVTSTGEADGGVAVSTADDATNGDITFYYEDPADDPKGYSEIKVTFEISSGGTTATWTRYPKVHWDMAKVEAALDALADEEIPASELLSYEGGTANDATGEIDARKNLYPSTYIGSWADISWTTSNADVIEADGTIHRLPSEDREATLTATVTFAGNLDESETAPTVTRDFHVTVKAEDSDPTDEDYIEAAFDKFAPTDAATKEPLAWNEAAKCYQTTGDVQLPTKGSLGVTGSAYKLSYELVDGGDALSLPQGGYRIGVTRPDPGLAPASGTLRVTISRNDASITREYRIEVLPLDESELDAEIALMEQVKANVSEGILGENESADAVTENLHSFQQARSDGNGGLVWAHARDEVEGSGIVPVAIDETHPSEQWNLFRSSRADIITHEDLRLQKQPTYDTQVTIELCLSSEKFGGYYEKYKDDPTVDPGVLAKYRALSRQPVSVTVTVKGTKGENPNPPAALDTTVAVVSEDGTPIVPKRAYAAGEGQTAWDATAAVLDDAGCTYAGAGILSSVTTPDGTVWGSSPYNWTLYVNGEYSDQYAFNRYLADGDDVAWVYSADGSTAELPAPDVEVDPDAPRPDWDDEASWPGYGNNGSSVVDAPTATQDGESKWTVGLKDPSEWGKNLSDPIVVNGRVYAVVGSELAVLDAQTGEELDRATLAAKADSVARMVYADGLIVVPLAGGRLQALTADTLTTVWLTDELPEGKGGAQQSLSTLTVRDGYVYYGTVSAGWSASYGGYLLCVRLEDGAIVWQHESEVGYYWAGAASVGDVVLIAEDATDNEDGTYTGGALQALDAATGEVLSELIIPGGARSTVVTDGEGFAYVASKIGVLHKVAVSADGGLTEVGSVKFGSSSTSTPAIVDGKAIVGGYSIDSHLNQWDYPVYDGIVAVIDTASMKVDRTVRTVDGSAFPGEVKSAPLVSKQESGTYVYFTANGEPGGVYCYRLGDAEATLLFEPDEEHQNYAMSSVVAGPDGTLYYVNDSGALFAIAGGPGKPSDGDDDTGDSEGPVDGSGGSAGETGGTSGSQDGGASGGKGTSSGSVAPGATPLASDASGEPGESGDDVGVAASADAAASASTAVGRDDGASAATTTAFGAHAPLLPVLGLGCGVVGLVAVGFWFSRLRR